MLFVLALILIQGLFADMAIPTASDIESIGHADTIQVDFYRSRRVYSS